ncbi:MAG: 4-hydroxythreonine-4-phosphate dehydrogenase PdxA [Elusimicrobiota bacterium]|jgi:4-hydroxythreonine-4-phosphate dehydrogenase
MKRNGQGGRRVRTAAAALPVLAFTCGDPAGVGPRVAVAALRDARVRRSCLPLAVGPRAVFVRAGWTPRLCPLLDLGSCGRIPVGGPSAEGGRVSWLSVLRAFELCARGLADGLVTAPVSKEAWRMAGAPYLDHTAALLDLSGAGRVAMMLCAPAAPRPLRATLVTRHVPYARVPALLTRGALREAAELTLESLRRDLGLRRPRVGVCALNPHAGENGLLGDEERRLLLPALRALRREGLPLEGPLPADAAWAAHAEGRFDALLALYHDQALIPLKLAARYGAVNWTLGLPFTRVSPMHGTAYDAARSGRIDPSGMIAAAVFAAEISSRKARS